MTPDDLKLGELPPGERSTATLVNIVNDWPDGPIWKNGELSRRLFEEACKPCYFEEYTGQSFRATRWQRCVWWFENWQRRLSRAWDALCDRDDGWD